jgi:capsular exopolysaccharide synthesis family protein
VHRRATQLRPIARTSEPPREGWTGGARRYSVRFGELSRRKTDTCGACVDFRELLEVLWRRKLTLVAVVLIAVAAAVVVLRVVTPQYESTSTLSLNPRNARDDIFILSTINAVTPVYATAAIARQTEDEAKRQLGGKLGSITVRTYTDTPIMKIFSRDPDATLAKNSAQAVTEALIRRVQSGVVGTPSVKLTQIDRPVEGTSPVFPRYNLTLGVAILMGLAFGIAAALLRENLTSKVETSEALAQLTGVPTFAEIPNEPAVGRVHEPEGLLSNPRLRALSESLRDLRTNLLFSSGNVKSIVITSPEGSHGKTTMSLGLAVTMARAGSRTILIDADLRKGRMAELLEVNRTPGLNDVLRGTPIEEVIQHSTLENLDLIPGGELQADPGEMLMSEFPDVLGWLEEHYDVVVVDTTPLVPVNDARVIASQAEAVLIVASAESATRRQVRSAVERLHLVSVTPTAVILNNSRAARAKGYYGYLAAPEQTAEKRPRRKRRLPARS